jgi:peptide/nickel transport system substrate-binding protein
MRNLAGRLRAIVASGIIAFALGSCRLAPSGDAGALAAAHRRPANQIVFGVVWEPVGFYPIRAIDSASYYAQSLVYEGLVKYDPDLNIVPALAKSFAISEDGLTYTFVLRENLKFSDGTAVGQKDIIESFKAAIARGSPFKSDYKDMASFSGEGADRFVVRLAQPNAAFLSRLAELKILPARLLTTDDRGWSHLMTHPVGTGAYMLSRWQTGLELVFVPNPFYRGERPRIDALIWRIVPDKTLLALALNRGEVDVAPVDPQSWDRLLSHNAKLVLDRFNGSRTIYLGFNCARKPFDDLELRKAICLAVDKQSLAQTLFGEYARVPASDAPFGTWFFNPNARALPYDPEQARRILESVSKRQGGPLAGFRIKTLRDFQDVAQIVSNDLRKVGVKNEVEILEYTTLKRSALQAGDFSTFVWSRSAGPDPECGIVWGPGGTLNYVRFANQSLGELLEQGRHSLNRAQRKQAYGRVQEILADQVPWDFLVQPNLLIAHSRDCHNIKRARQQQPSLPWDNPLFNAPDWYIDQTAAEQGTQK